jgi:hypothetical protein
MVAPPIVTPDTTPEVEPTDAMVGALLPHSPVPASASVIVEPKQTLVGPLMAAGDGLTVNVLLAKQPVPGVKL